MATTTSPSRWDPTPNPSSAAPGSASGSSAAKSSSPCPPTHPPRSSAPATTPPSRAPSPSASAQVRSFVRVWQFPPHLSFITPPVSSYVSLIYLTKTFFPPPGEKTVDAKCTANLFSAGRTDRASFYDIWQGVTAMFSVCVRKGYSGSVRGIGAFFSLFFLGASL